MPGSAYSGRRCGLDNKFNFLKILVRGEGGELCVLGGDTPSLYESLGTYSSMSMSGASAFNLHFQISLMIYRDSIWTESGATYSSCDTSVPLSQPRSFRFSQPCCEDILVVH